MRLVKISDYEALKKEGIPYKPNTLYQWRSQGKNKELFVKLDGLVCIDVDKFKEWVEKKTSKN